MNFTEFNKKEREKLEGIMLEYTFAKEIMETELKILLKEYEFKNKYNPVEHIKSRIKSSESATNKMKKRGYDLIAENLVNHVHDMVGIRIVCSFLSDVKSIVNIIKSSKQFKIKNESDYITNPKKSGYISYHMNILVPIHFQDTTKYVEVEIQIRTIAMDFWASLDHKLRYKLTEDIPDDIANEVYICSGIIKSLDNEMEKLNEEIKKYKN